MSNDEGRKKDEYLMTKQAGYCFRPSGFVIPSSLVIRHSSSPPLAAGNSLVKKTLVIDVDLVLLPAQPGRDDDRVLPHLGAPLDPPGQLGVLARRHPAAGLPVRLA